MHAGTRYDPIVVDALARAMRQAPAPAPQPQRRLLGSTDLHPGMCLAEDLVAPSGVLLPARGRQLNKAVIAHIKRVEELTGALAWLIVARDDQAAST